MKMKHLLVAGASLGLFTFTACQKEEKTTAEKLQGKWQVESFIENDYYDDQPHIDTFHHSGADYIDFRADGKAYSFNSTYDSYDTSAYAIQNDSKILYDGDVYNIHTLTSSVLKLHVKDTLANSTDYFEVMVNLKK